MKKTYLLFTVAMLVSLAGCNNSNNESNTEPYYDSEGHIHYNPSKFFILKDDKKGFKTDEFGDFTYKYHGNLYNGTNRIFKKATVSMVLIFDLDNGQQLTDSVINADHPLMAMGGLEEKHFVEMFQPKQTYPLQEFESYPISKEYKKYPIKKMVVSFRIELYDEINDKYYYRFIKDEDITDEWKRL
jgi:hypothetical protein